MRHSARAAPRRARRGAGRAAPARRTAGHQHAAARQDPPQDGRPQPAAGPAGRSRLDQVPYIVVLCGIVAGLAWMHGGGGDVRGGTLVIAGVLLAAAVTRLGLPERRAGLLASRARLLDAAALTALGFGLLVAGLVFPTLA